MSRPITGARVLAIAAPVVVSNATVPLQGALDTAIIGNMGGEAELGGVGIGAEVFAVIYTTVNFLQIGSSGLAAQALGAGRPERVVNVLARTLVVAGVIAALVLATHALWTRAALGAFEASAEAESIAMRYMTVRVWGAPFELAALAVLGWLAGQELTRWLFRLQLVTTLSNMALSLALAVGLGWGVEGVAAATVIASGIGLAYGLHLARKRTRSLLPRGWRPNPRALLERAELWRVMAINRDLAIRSLLLTGSFFWVLRLGSLQGDLILAANVVLWQFFIVSAYALDGFAIAAESLVGQAKGAGDRAMLRRAAVVSSLWSGASAVVVALLFLALSGPIIDLFTTDAAVRETARSYVAWAAVIPAVGFAAYQLDGIFIGATESAAMRNAMLISAGAFIPVSWWAVEAYGNHALWACVHGFLLLRAATLLWRYPALERGTSAPTHSATEA